MSYEEMKNKELIKKFIVENYPQATSTPKMKRSLNNFSLDQLKQLKEMIVKNKLKINF